MDAKELRATLRADLAANRGYPKSVLVVVLLRIAQFVRALPGPAGRLAYIGVGAAYKFVVEWVLGIEIPASTSIGPGLRLRHGVGTVVNPRAVLGSGVMLRHGVTIGNRRSETDCPTIEDDVEFGAGATAIGSVRIGRGARLGVNVVVIDDVPAGATVYSASTVTRQSRRRAPEVGGQAPPR